MRSLLATFFTLLAAAALLSAEETDHGDKATDRSVLKVQLEDEAITPATVRFLERALDRATDEQAECLVIELDTPGGLLNSTRQIVKRILGSRTPVVIYVAPAGGRAASAGMFVTLSAHAAAMAPGTTIGAAHPVQVGGLPIGPQQPGKQSPSESDDNGEKTSSPKPSPMEEKIVNDTVAWARSLAGLRDRNAEWVADAVTNSVSATLRWHLRGGGCVVFDFVHSHLVRIRTRRRLPAWTCLSGTERPRNHHGVLAD